MSGNSKALVWIDLFLTRLTQSNADHVHLADVNESMDIPLEDMQGVLDPHISHFGHHKDLEPETSIYDLLNSERFSHNKSPLTEG